MIRPLRPRPRHDEHDDPWPAAEVGPLVQPLAVRAPRARNAAESDVPVSILGPGGQAGIPTIPGVTMPDVVWADPLLDGWGIWPRSDAGRVRRAAQVAAEGPHHGDPLEEPGLARLLADIQTKMTMVLRGDPEVLGAQHLDRTCRARVESSEDAVTLVRAEHATTIGGEDIAADATDPRQQQQWTAAHHARALIHAVEAAHREALNDSNRATQLLEVAGDRAIERIHLVALAGVDRLHLYWTTFNQQRFDRPGLDPLPADLADDLVRRTVQPAMSAETPDDDDF